MDISVSKLEAAGRQLNIALDLYFHNRDIIAIHTLAAASNNVIIDISRNYQRDNFSLKTIISKGKLDKELKNKIFNEFNKPANFFKHANIDFDPEGILTFPLELTEYILFETVEMYIRLTDKGSPLFVAYRSWYVRDMIDNLEIYALFSEKDQIIFKSISGKTKNRLEYLNMILPIIKKFYS